MADLEKTPKENQEKAREGPETGSGKGPEEKQKASLGSVPIPSEIFKDRSLSVLEILVEYMKDRLGYSYHEIAVLLNRNDRTIWTVYSRAKKKRQSQEKKQDSQKPGKKKSSPEEESRADKVGEDNSTEENPTEEKTQ